MDTLPDISETDKLAAELDFRLNYVYGIVDREGREVDAEEMGALRMAYAQGYIDALTEENSGQLLDDAPGFRILGRRR